MGTGQLKKRLVKNESAFTLLELLCVIALLGMLTMIAMPAVADFSRKRNLDIAARSIATEIRKCQQQSIVSGHPRCIEFLLHNPYYDYRVKDCFTNETERFLLPEGTYINSTTIGTAGGSNPCLRFFPGGTVSGGGTLVLRNEHDHLVYVVVAPVTGRVRISDQPPEHW